MSFAVNYIIHFMPAARFSSLCHLYLNKAMSLFSAVSSLLTISVLQAYCAVITEYAIPSNFVKTWTASLQIKISAALQFFEWERNIYSESGIINKDNQAQIKSLQRCFIQHLYRSSY